MAAKEQYVDIGDKVVHSQWGEGTVLNKWGWGEHTKLIVAFPELGQKKLLLKHARLKKVKEKEKRK
jgi:DNA helicase-2/ATP-dependent DNA helicase PcrA